MVDVSGADTSSDKAGGGACCCCCCCCFWNMDVGDAGGSVEHVIGPEEMGCVSILLPDKGESGTSPNLVLCFCCPMSAG